MKFLREKLGFTIAYFCGTGLVMLFYYLSYNKSSELAYPLALVLFVYIIYMIIEFIRFKKFLSALRYMEKYKDYKKVNGVIEECTQDTINNIHNEYLNRIAQNENNYIEESRLLSATFHNMKTPISVNSLLIQRYEKDEIDKEFLINVIKEEEAKLMAYIDGIINVKRLREFRKDYEAESIDLCTEVRRIINENKKLFIFKALF